MAKIFSCVMDSSCECTVSLNTKLFSEICCLQSTRLLVGLKIATFTILRVCFHFHAAPLLKKITWISNSHSKKYTSQSNNIATRIILTHDFQFPQNKKIDIACVLLSVMSPILNRLNFESELRALYKSEILLPSQKLRPLHCFL